MPRTRRHTASPSLAMNATLLLLNLAYLGHTSIEAVEYISEGACTPVQQMAILEDVTQCAARETLVDLREHMPNVSNVIQVIPDFATVRRCGGSCDLYSHRCIPSSTRVKRLDVMVVLSQFPSEHAETHCGYVEVEEHVGCTCDCPVQPHHCRADQYYEQSSCRCLCRDQARRNQCVQRGMQWDPVNCMCVCPMASWKVCSTGYIFDFSQTCQCVPTSTTASMGLLVAVIVLLTCLMITVVGIVFMYRRQTGLFRTRSRRDTAANAEAAKNLNDSNYDLVKDHNFT